MRWNPRLLLIAVVSSVVFKSTLCQAGSSQTGGSFSYYLPSDTTGRLAIQEFISIVPDPGRLLSFDSVASPAFQKIFDSAIGHAINNDVEVHWGRLLLSSDTTQAIYLDFDAKFDSVRLFYQPLSDTSWLTLHNGLRVRFEDRVSKVHKNVLSYILHVNKCNNKPVYFQFISTTPLVKKTQEIGFFSRISTDATEFIYYTRIHVWKGFFLGLTMISIVVSILLFSIRKQIYYIYYVAFLLFTITTLGLLHGDYQPTFLNQQPIPGFIFFYWSVWAMSSMYLLFYLDYYKKNGLNLLFSALKYTTIIYVAASAISLLWGRYELFMLLNCINMLAHLMMMLLSTIEIIRQKEKNKTILHLLFFLPSSLMQVASIIIGIGTMWLNVMEYSLFFATLGFTSNFLRECLFLLATSFEFMITAKKLHKAELERVALEKENERLERKRIEEIARFYTVRNLELEEKVKEKTASLAEQNQQIVRQDEERKRLFNNIAHEIRTPLTLIEGPVKLLREEARTMKYPESWKPLLQMVSYNIDYLKLLTENALLIMQAGQVPVKIFPQWVSSQSIVNNARSMFESMATLNKVSISFENGLKNRDLYTDEKLLEIIIYNLISNAVKFTPPGGLISVLLSYSGNAVEFTVEDSGRGIDAEERMHVFDPFYQGKKSAVQGGIGAGLSVVKNLVEQLHGNIVVQNSSNKGAKILVTIPHIKTRRSTLSQLRSKAFYPGDTWNDSNHENDASSNRAKILVVEDYPFMRQYINIILSKHYHVINAQNGAEALDILNAENIDLVVTDIMMPVMDGMELLKQMDKHPLLNLIPTIVITAKSNEEDKLEILKLGINDYLTKPFDKNELEVRISNLLSYARIRKTASLKGYPVDPQQENEMIESMNNFLEANYHRFNLILVEIANVLAVSERKLYRLTQHKLGMSPAEYLREFRLKKSLVLLQTNGAIRLTEIAKVSGFSSLSSFSKIFKKRFGTSPEDFRKKYHSPSSGV